MAFEFHQMSQEQRIRGIKSSLLVGLIYTQIKLYLHSKFQSNQNRHEGRKPHRLAPCEGSRETERESLSSCCQRWRMAHELEVHLCVHDASSAKISRFLVQKGRSGCGLITWSKVILPPAPSEGSWLLRDRMGEFVARWRTAFKPEVRLYVHNASSARVLRFLGV